MKQGASALWNGEAMGDQFVSQAKQYLASLKDSHASFFLYLSSQEFHVPRAPHLRFKGKSELSNRGDGSGPYRGGKYQIYEGGTRVPFSVRWPSRVEPGKSDALVSQIDFIASFAALLGAELKPEQSVDSRSILPALLGESKSG